MVTAECVEKSAYIRLKSHIRSSDKLYLDKIYFPNNLKINMYFKYKLRPYCITALTVKLSTNKQTKTLNM